MTAREAEGKGEKGGGKPEMLLKSEEVTALPLVLGDTASTEAAAAPALSPMMVTCDGSPFSCLMFAWIHSKAITRSQMPRFPSALSSFW